MLLQIGANPDYLDSEGHSALFESISYDNVPLAKVLIDAGASPDLLVCKRSIISGYKGFTALYVAAITNTDPDFIDLLTKAGANPNF
jgi:ankyrin repeat protein